MVRTVETTTAPTATETRRETRTPAHLHTTTRSHDHTVTPTHRHTVPLLCTYLHWPCGGVVTALRAARRTLAPAAIAGQEIRGARAPSDVENSAVLDEIADLIADALYADLLNDSADSEASRCVPQGERTEPSHEDETIR